MSLYAIEITTTCYVTADSTEEAEAKALAHRTEWLDPIVNAAEIEELADIPERHRETYVAGAELRTVADVLGEELEQ